MYVYVNVHMCVCMYDEENNGYFLVTNRHTDIDLFIDVDVDVYTYMFMYICMYMYVYA